MDTKNEQSVGQTREQEQSQGVAAVAAGSPPILTSRKNIHMGMDLKPLRPSKAAPRYPADAVYTPNRPIWGCYNWNGWFYLQDRLREWGVDISEFRGVNDGDKISAKTCRAVADAIEKHLAGMDERDRNWLSPHVKLWRTCGGYAQH